MINTFKAAHHLIDVTVVDDAGMISQAYQYALQAARRYRTVTIQAGNQTLISAEPAAADLAQALAKIHELHAH